MSRLPQPWYSPFTAHHAPRRTSISSRGSKTQTACAASSIRSGTRSSDRERIAWNEGTLSVVSRDGLITLKLTAGRAQDLVDIQSLTAAEGHRRGPS